MKKIFEDNPDINKTAYLNWRMQKHDPIHNFMVLGDGYLCSAIELAKGCLKNNEDKKADMLIFPILHNANHGIELYLKALIKTIDFLLNNKESDVFSHNIFALYKLVRERLLEHKDQDWLNDFDSQNHNLKEYLDELFPLIQLTDKYVNTDFPRYPQTLKKKNPFYVDELSNVVIDLENFVERFEVIQKSLAERVEYFYYVEFELSNQKTNVKK